MHSLTVLPNKLKLIIYPMPHIHSVSSGVFVKTGSRYEPAKLAGISHFSEHMFFKGTRKRPTPLAVSTAIEGMGGYLNAATSQDYTFFYNRLPSRHFARGLEFLADSLHHSLFDRAAIERERGVILEELNMYLDTPIRYIDDLIMQTLWPAAALGRDVIGEPETVKKIKRADFINYLKLHYQPSNQVVVVAGQINKAKIINLVKKYFQQKNSVLPRAPELITERQTSPRVKIQFKKTDQIHLALAVPSLPRNHPAEAASSLLDTILGTGMSSRLFQNIREKLGLCYAIGTNIERFEETGLFTVTAGLNSDKIKEAIVAILSELKQLTVKPVARAEMQNAKEYLRGSLALQLDNSDNMAIWYGSQALFYPTIKTPEQRMAELQRVSAGDIIKLARALFQSQRLNLALIGPFKAKDEARFLKLLKIR